MRHTVSSWQRSKPFAIWMGTFQWEPLFLSADLPRCKLLAEDPLWRRLRVLQLSDLSNIVTCWKPGKKHLSQQWENMGESYHIETFSQFGLEGPPWKTNGVGSTCWSSLKERQPPVDVEALDFHFETQPLPSCFGATLHGLFRCCPCLSKVGCPDSEGGLVEVDGCLGPKRRLSRHWDSQVDRKESPNNSMVLEKPTTE